MTFSPTKSAELVRQALEDDERMTPGPWKADEEPGCRGIKGDKSGRHKQAQYTEIAFTVGLSDDDRDAANAAGIARTRNSLRAMAEQLEAACAEVERWRAFQAQEESFANDLTAERDQLTADRDRLAAEVERLTRERDGYRNAGATLMRQLGDIATTLGSVWPSSATQTTAERACEALRTMHEQLAKMRPVFDSAVKWRERSITMIQDVTYANSRRVDEALVNLRDATIDALSSTTTPHEAGKK